MQTKIIFIALKNQKLYFLIPSNRNSLPVVKHQVYQLKDAEKKLKITMVVF
jgi:hypothetical protein